MNGPASLSPQELIRRLIDIVGESHVLTDEPTRRLFSSDAFWVGAPALAVVSPGTSAETARVVGAVTSAGFAVVPRGGGMSYTKGYVADRADAITLDTRRLDRTVAINAEDLSITVEAGRTWKDIYESLKPLGLRTPYFGPMSGLRATVGGTLSNNSMFFGSGVYGTAAENVLSLKVALADGSIIDTGSAGQKNGAPFHRSFGPDLTGLFLSDAGALGVKLQATFCLIRTPLSTRFASFAFETFEELFEAQAEIARERLAAECYGFDPFLNRSLKSLGAGQSAIGTVANVVKSAGSLGQAIGDVATLARGGRGVVDEIAWSLHLVVEGFDEVVTGRALARLRRHALRKGREIPATVPTVIRAEPFKDPGEFLLGHEGERWQPIHACLPFSRVLEARRRTEEYFARQGAGIDRFHVQTSLLTAVSGTDFIFEPAFYYPDAPAEFHRAFVPDAARLNRHAGTPGAREFVVKMLTDLLSIYRDLGAVHQQLGRFYGYAEALSPVNAATLRSIRAILDPHGLMNPGALGL